MEYVLRPSVSCARHYAEHVLHAESDARPVVGLDLRHGNQEIRFQHRSRKPEFFQACVGGSQPRADQFVAIQIYESNLFVSKTLLIPSLRKNESCIALMPRTLSNYDRLSAHVSK